MYYLYTAWDLKWSRLPSVSDWICFFQQIAESVKERLLKFHEKAGLAFAAYDFLDLGDDVIFLECNACRAAWLWLEMAVGINVSENVAQYLLGKEETDTPWAMDSV